MYCYREFLLSQTVFFYWQNSYREYITDVFQRDYSLCGRETLEILFFGYIWQYVSLVDRSFTFYW